MMEMVDDNNHQMNIGADGSTTATTGNDHRKSGKTMMSMPPQEHCAVDDENRKSMQFLLMEAKEQAKLVKLSKQEPRKTAQRGSPKRGRSASCWAEFCRCGGLGGSDSKVGKRKSLDDRIGRRVESKSLMDRAKEHWESVNLNQDKVLDFMEVKALFRNLNLHIPDREIRAYMDRFDVDKNGVLDYKEFEIMFEAIQSRPDLKQEFLMAKILGSGEDAVKDIANENDIRLYPEDLMAFIAWSTNEEETPTLEECAYFIHVLSSERRFVGELTDGWAIPADVLSKLDDGEYGGGLSLPTLAESSLEESDFRSAMTSSPNLRRNEEAEDGDSGGASSPTILNRGVTVDGALMSSRPKAMTSRGERSSSNPETHNDMSATTSPLTNLNRNSTGNMEARHGGSDIMKQSGGNARLRNYSKDSQQSTGLRKRDRLRNFLTRHRSRSGSSQDSDLDKVARKYQANRKNNKTNSYPSWHPISSKYNPPAMDYECFCIMITDRVHNGAGNPTKMSSVYQDMTRPLSHYFISSSHNSYLTGNQLNSDSSAYAISRALKLGVRVIELDAWNGPNDEPIVTHGNTLCKPMPFIDCIHTLKKYGFVASPYPVIVTIENHCNMEQQRKQVQYMKDIFGDQLYQFPVPDPTNLKVGVSCWASPEELKHKIVIRDRPNKRMTKQDIVEVKSRKQRSESSAKAPFLSEATPKASEEETVVEEEEEEEEEDVEKSSKQSGNVVAEKSGSFLSRLIPSYSLSTDINRKAGHEDDEDPGNEMERFHEGGDDEIINDEEALMENMNEDDDDDQHYASEELDAGSGGVTPALLKLMYIKNISLPLKKTENGDIAVYISPPYCSSSSISETKLQKLAEPGPKAAALNTYAKTHLVRVFPAGSRISSSNFDPVAAWNTGCQIVALNYQSFGPEVWLSQGKFSDNGGSGYVLKPVGMLDAVSTGVENTFSMKKQSAEVDDENSSLNAETGKVNRGNASKAMRLFGHKSIRFGVGGVPSLPWSLTEGDASFTAQPSILKIEIISGHYIPRPEHGSNLGSFIVNPYVELTIRGLRDDDKTVRTTFISNNGFDPTWRETFEFPIHNKELTLVSFIVRSIDTSRPRSKGMFLGQNCYPLSCLRQGYRYVHLRYANWALTDDAFLLVKIRIDEPGR